MRIYFLQGLALRGFDWQNAVEPNLDQDGQPKNHLSSSVWMSLISKEFWLFSTQPTNIAEIDLKIAAFKNQWIDQLGKWRTVDIW